jgi:hypothetical protein
VPLELSYSQSRKSSKQESATCRLRSVLVAVFLVLLGGSMPSGPSTTRLVAQAKKVDPATITVYVTRTGEKYHNDGCRSLRQSKIPMSLKEAAQRYGPCSICKPPRVR